MSFTTMTDIARRARVSPMTVSLVLRSSEADRNRVGAATRKRVLAVVGELKYRMHPAARALRQGRSFNIGFHINLPDFQWSTPSWNNLISPLQRQLWHFGYQFGFYHFLPKDLDQLKEFLAPHRFVDGIVTLGRNLSRREIAAIRESGIRAVSLYEKIPGFISLLIDEHAAGAAAADYLYARGHRQVGIMGYRVGVARWYGRAAGFLKRAAQLGLSVPEDARCITTRDLIGSERRVARELFRGFLKTGSPVRCFWIPSDYLAFGVLEELDERGLRLGQDFSILSYDNFEGTGYAPWGKPRLSSFEPPLAEIGKKAAMLLAEETDDAETTCQLFQSHLVERGSVMTRVT